jgi:26S proteasome regulatory subunit N9
MKIAGASNKLLQENQKILGIKIRLMAFLELLFQLPKNERVVSFEKIAKECSIPVDEV